MTYKDKKRKTDLHILKQIEILKEILMYLAKQFLSPATADMFNICPKMQLSGLLAPVSDM